jgi:hypothetical protein
MPFIRTTSMTLEHGTCAIRPTTESVAVLPEPCACCKGGPDQRPSQGSSQNKFRLFRANSHTHVYCFSVSCLLGYPQAYALILSSRFGCLVSASVGFTHFAVHHASFDECLRYLTLYPQFGFLQNRTRVTITFRISHM